MAENAGTLSFVGFGFSGKTDVQVCANAIRIGFGGNVPPQHSRIRTKYDRDRLPHVSPATSYVATFADLPFYAVIAGVDVAKVVEVASELEAAQSSYAIIPPSITLEYDDACTRASASASASVVPVPALGPLQTVLLVLLLVGNACLYFPGNRTRC